MLPSCSGIKPEQLQWSKQLKVLGKKIWEISLCTRNSELPCITFIFCTKHVKYSSNTKLMAPAIQPRLQTIVMFVEENEKIPILAIQLNLNGLFMVVTGMEFEHKNSSFVIKLVATKS